MRDMLILIPFVSGCFCGWLATSIYYLYQVRRAMRKLGGGDEDAFSGAE